MILDDLSQWRRYAALLPRLATAFEFLQALDSSSADGRYELDGDHVYCLVQRYKTKPIEKAMFEAHRQYADVQFIISGREAILWAPLAALTTVTQPYRPEKDIVFFASPASSTALRMSAGQFAVLFPEDGHAPCVADGDPCEVVKAVVKVRV